MSDKRAFIPADEFMPLLSDGVDQDVLEMHDFLVDVAIQLIRLRKSQNWTQQEAAQQCGVKQAMISKLESGEYNPSIGTLWKHARKLGARIKVQTVLDAPKESVDFKPLTSEKRTRFQPPKTNTTCLLADPQQSELEVMLA